MARFLGVVMDVALVGVTLVQHPGRCWAAETTGQGVSGSLYAGGGTAEEPNNEGAPAEYDERRAGAGVVGVLRFRAGAGSVARGPERQAQETEEAQPVRRDGVSGLGAFVMLGATVELESRRQTQCGWACGSGGETAETGFQTEKHFGGRVDVGYGFELVELRAGVLATMPDPNARLAESLVMPEGLVRIGRRRIGWFELGLGAYDASTNLRPGLFVGGAYGSDQELRVSGHLGLHLPNGLCCSSVPRFALRYELGLERALTEMVHLGVGGAVYNADAIEGSARLSLLL